MRLHSISWKLYIIAMIIFVLVATSNYCIAQKDDTDSDQDGLPDSWENQYFGNITIYSSSDDPDNDNLTNIEEFNLDTNPVDPDTDSDSMPDDWEVSYNQIPNDSVDQNLDNDNDGYTNLQEFQMRSDPTDPKDPAVPHDKKKDEEEDIGTLGLGGEPIITLLLFGVPTIVILLAIIFVYTKMRREQLLEHKVRSQIYDYINKNPGTHYRGIMNDLSLHMGVLTHHLNMLEQEQYIKSLQDGMYRRFYPKNYQVKPGLVLTNVQERILRAIQGTPGISQTVLAQTLGLTKTIVNYQVKILSNAGFVHMETVGRESQLFYLDGLDLDRPAGVGSEAG